MPLVTTIFLELNNNAMWSQSVYLVKKYFPLVKQVLFLCNMCIIL